MHSVVLHEPGLGVNLRELLLAHARNAAEGIEQYGPGAGGALV